MSRVLEQEGKGAAWARWRARQAPACSQEATSLGLGLGSGREAASCCWEPLCTTDIQVTLELGRLLLSPFLHFEKSQQNPYFHKHFFWL